MTSVSKILSTAVLAAAFGFALYETNAAVRLHDDVLAGRQRLDRLVVAERDAKLAHKNASRQLGQPLALRARTPPNAFAPGSDASFEAEIAAWLGRTTAVRKALADHPELRIPEMRLLTDEDWIHASQGFSSWTQEISKEGVRTEVDFLPNLENLRTIARRAFISAAADALQKYHVENHGELPASFDPLIPFLPPSVDSAIISRYDLVQENGRIIVAERAAGAVDPDRLAVFEYDRKGFIRGRSSDFESALVRNAREANLRYAAAHGGAYATEAAQLTSFLPHPMSSSQLTESFDQLPDVYRVPSANSP